MSAAIADELDALFAAPVRVTVGGKPVAIGGRPVEVRGVRLGELAEFLRLYADKPADGVADDAPEVAAWNARVLRVLSQLSGEPEAWLAALDDEQLDALFAAMWQANRVLFDPGAGVRHGPRGARDHISWATAAAALIEAGHRHEDVARYTLLQIEQYMAAHARLAADRRVDALSIARAARAEAKGFRQFLRSLEQARARLGR